MKTAVHMLEDRILVKPRKTADVTSGGIHLPDQALEKSTRGTVLRVGPGRSFDDGKIQPMRLEPGMVVVFNTFAGDEIKIEEEKYLIMRERDVFCWLEEPSAS